MVSLTVYRLAVRFPQRSESFFSIFRQQCINGGVVLQVPQHLCYWYQKSYTYRQVRLLLTRDHRALLTEELEAIFRDAPPPPSVIAAEHVRDAYAKATGKSPATAEDIASKSGRRVPDKDDDCPICYETMYKVKEADLTYCSTCGNALHRICFQQCPFLRPCIDFLVLK